MRRSLWLGAVLLCALLMERTASAMPRFLHEVLRYKEDIRPIHVFGLALVFLVIFIFGRYLEWSAKITLSSALLCGLSVGFAIVWAMTGDLVRSRTHFLDADAEPRPKVQKAEKPAVAAAQAERPSSVGRVCRAAEDCSEGTICSRVAGKQKCWLPCADDGACAAGYICMPVEHGLRVCVR